MASEHSLEYYRALPYRRVVERVSDDEGVYYVCRFPELRGLAADGSTPAEAAKNAADAFDDYIRALLEWGHEVRLPEGRQRKARAPQQGDDPSAEQPWTIVHYPARWPDSEAEGEKCSVSGSEQERDTVSESDSPTTTKHLAHA